MAALGHTVDSGSGASGDYASLNALEAAQQQDLTDGEGDTYTATCTTTGDNAPDTTPTDFLTWITAAANYIEIVAANGDEAVKTGIDMSRYRLSIGVGMAIRMREDYIRVDKLQILVDATDGGSFGLGSENINVSNDLRISNCYIKGALGANTERGIAGGDPDANLKIWNTIVMNCRNDGIFVSTITAEIYNCIIYN